MFGDTVLLDVSQVICEQFFISLLVTIYLIILPVVYVWDMQTLKQ